MQFKVFFSLKLFDNCLLLLESTNPADRSSSATLLGYLLQSSLRKKAEKSSEQNSREEYDGGETNKQNGGTSVDNKTEKCVESASLNPETNAPQNENPISSKENNATDFKEDNLPATESLPASSESRSAKLPSSPLPSNPPYRVPKKVDHNQPIAILSFLQQNDPSQEVRNSARVALLNLGTQGQEALHQVQLSSHGFQGVHIKDCKDKT